jgi:hypothetical protein
MKLPEKVLDKINEYYKFCIIKYHYHLKAAEKYKLLYIYTTAPIIVFSSITTVLASYNGNTIDQNLAIAVAIFSGLTTIGQALVSFVEYNTKYTAHFAISNKFMNLARMIETEVTINYFNTINDNDDETITKAYIKFLFDKIYTGLTTIQDAEPYLPMVISNKKYIDLMSCETVTNDVVLIPDELTNFINPDLISPELIIHTLPVI